MINEQNPSPLACSTSMSQQNAQLEHLQKKYVGTGGPETTKQYVTREGRGQRPRPWCARLTAPRAHPSSRTCSEWAVTQHRDTYASHLGHGSMVQFLSIAENESQGRVRASLLEKMFHPCGDAPLSAEEARRKLAAEEQGVEAMDES